MCDVFLDGEKVEFSGPSPTSLSEVHSALEDALSANGRVLAALTIDGQPFDESLRDRAIKGLRIEAASITLADALRQVGVALIPDVRELKGKALELARTVLRSSWTEMQQPCMELVETAAGVLQRAVQVASLSGVDDAPLARAVTTLAASLEGWMKGIEQRDAAQIALHLDGRVAPALEQLAVGLKESSST